ncbi:MAG: acyltransferase family protein [Candidatus Paceibacterota bacterium]|jgi:fucose 4-O-acetylase-like acetyltransferase
MNNNQTKNREYFLDIAKGIGISLVILDHSAIGKSIINYAYVFNMPLFFFAAGYLLNFSKYQNY